MPLRRRRAEPRQKPAALFAAPPQPFKAGDRVRCKIGRAKGQLGTVVRRRYHEKISTHAGPDQVWVLFDGTSAAAKTRRVAIEKVK